MKKHVRRVQNVCRQVCETSPEMKRKVRIAYSALIAIAILAGALLVTITELELQRIEEALQRSEAPPFPVGVDALAERIVEQPEVDAYFAVHISTRTNRPKELSWVEQSFQKIAESKWFQQLATPAARVLVSHPGERKEQIAENFGDLLDWTPEEEVRFMELVDSESNTFVEGIYFPDRYLTHKEASPEEVAFLVTSQFEDEVQRRYTDEVAAQIPFEDALIIASLLEREAYDFTDMREISGIIWNRLFIDMNLQLDATLQYAKANGTEGPWWPRVLPDDKYIDSPFNTYANAGLPPAPIGSPSLDSILAALNPIETDCMFYFHDDYSRFHCSATYEEHVQRLRDIYGQGR